MCNPPAQLSMGTEKMSSDAKTTIPGIQKAGTYQPHRQRHSEKCPCLYLINR